MLTVVDGGARATRGRAEADASWAAPWWKLLGRRYGHVLHSMCSYMGSFPAGLPRYFIEQFSGPGDVVLDPFSGRGTTPLEACLAGRLGLGVDLNPLAALLTDVKVDRVFIGSCTNGRLEDLRAAAAIVQGRRVAPGVEAWAVPGSGLVRASAEAEGLDRIFRDAGFEWRYAGCSMCAGMNGDTIAPGKRSASTSNRNFAGRQGPGARTHLVSPIMAAAAAVTGHLTDVRPLLRD